MKWKDKLAKLPVINNRMYNVDVEIFEQRANGIVVLNDRARRIREGSVEKYHLLRSNEMISPPKFEKLILDSRGSNKLKLFLPQTGQYQPIKFQYPNTLTVEDKDVRFWHTQSTKDTVSIYEKKSKWAEIMPYAFLALQAMLIIVQLIMFNRGMVTMTGGINNAADKFLNAVKLATNIQLS